MPHTTWCIHFSPELQALYGTGVILYLQPYTFFKFFFIIINSKIYITFTIRTNNTNNTLETKKERKKNTVTVTFYIPQSTKKSSIQF